MCGYGETGPSKLEARMCERITIPPMLQLWHIQGRTKNCWITTPISSPGRKSELEFLVRALVGVSTLFKRAIKLDQSQIATSHMRSLMRQIDYRVTTLKA